MAKTEISTSHNLTVKKWSAVLFKAALGKLYFGKFVGKSADSIVQTKTDLTKEKGDQITFGLRMPLTGDGRVDDQEIEGNEEAMTFYDFPCLINLRGNGVRANGKMSVRRPAFDLKTEMKDALAGWMSEVIDNDTVAALSGIGNSAGTIPAAAPHADRVFFGGQTTAGVMSTVADLNSVDSTTNHLFGTNVISHVKRMAKSADPKIRPIIVNGEERFVMFINPLQMKALRAEEAWREAQIGANIRGESNPIFSGAEGMWDGVIIHEYERIPYAAQGEEFDDGDAAGTTCARALFCGAQAGVHAYGQYPGWYEKNFDYGRVPGVATDIIIGIRKPIFDSKEYGVIAVNTAVLPD